MSRRLPLVLVFALLTLVLPLGTVVVRAAVPRTVSTTLEGLPAASDGYRTASTATGRAAVVSSRQVAPEIPFAMVGAEAPAGVDLRVRTSADGTTWGPWLELAPLAVDEGPDPGTEGTERAAGRVPTEAIWVGASRHVQVETTGGSPADVTLTLIDSVGLSPDTDRLQLGTARAGAATTAGFGYVSRSEWGADESIRRDAPRYASTVRNAVVHHTAGMNDYTRADAPAIVRGIYYYHVETQGWDDIGYNALVDRFGTVYEGRAGGLDRAVIGAHAAGFNTGSFGVSVMGSFTDVEPTAAAVSAVSDVLAWKFDLHGVDPYGRVTAGSGSRERMVDTISGHRDVGSTSCPGDHLHDDLDAIRGWTAQRMLADGFADVVGSVHAAAVDRIAEAGVTEGCAAGRYCPGREVTRAQMATFLTRTFLLTEGSDASFTDVPATHTHAAGIAAVVAAGIADGYEDGTFRPEAPVSREHMAAMLQRGLDLQPEDGLRFVDTAASRYRSSINALSSAAITGGCDGDRYCPTAAVTRAQMASFLDRTLTHLGR